MSQAEHPLVHIRVTSNVDSMRRGWEGQVPLTERIEALSMAGYLRILGHVDPPVVAPPPTDGGSPAGIMLLPEEMSFPLVEPVKPKRPSRRRPTSTEVDDGGSPGSP